MIVWRDGKAGFVGAAKRLIKGFFEYAHTVTTASAAPVLTLPTGTATGTTTATGTVTTNQDNGTLYFLASTNPSETAATIKLGSSQAVSVSGIQNVLFTGLTPITLYYAHYVHDDSLANESNVVSSSGFLTSSLPFTPSGENRATAFRNKNRALTFRDRNRKIL